uniref:Rab11 family-interacting protein 5 n=1 Tax=Xenopus tropicalis TaxID=8364 RepID=A0A6I8PVW5_XENTR
MFLRPEPELGWLPTHVQVTILQARGLRAKGKHGTSDAYTLIQIGREKYSTSVVEKSPGSPEWKEECSFELAPGALERAENCELQLTVMHRALIGMDQFLGQVTIPLQHVYQEGRSQRNQWYKLRSKPGKKEKERGEIQVSIQFTRNNLTASMFDLSIKDKPKTPFGKLKDKMKVKKLFDMESSSAIVPSSVGRLDSDDEDEKKPKSKAALFLKGRLRKNSLTRSNTSLGSDSTISSTSGTVANNAGISIVLPDPGKKPASRNSSLSVEPSAQSSEASPRMTHKRAFSDEVSQLSIFPEPKVVQNLKPKGSPISKSSVCINGSHVYTETPLPKPLPSPLEKLPPVSRSFQNISKKAEESSIPGAATGQLHSLDKQEKKPIASPTPAQEEVKVPAKSKNDEIHKESKPVQITSPMVFSEEPPKVKAQDGAGKEEKKPKANLFHHDSGTKIHVEPAHQTSVASEEKAKPGSWFGSKDPKETPQKPSLDVSPQVETSSSASCFLAPFPVYSLVVDAVSMPRTNTASGARGCFSANNPFLDSLQNNPFSEELLSDQLPNSSSPTHFFSSFPSGSIATSEAAERGSSLVEEHSPLAFSPAPEVHKKPLHQEKSASRNNLAEPHEVSLASRNPYRSPVNTAELEEEFDAFASSRLQPAIENPTPTEANRKSHLDNDGDLSCPGHYIQSINIQISNAAQKSDRTVGVLPRLLTSTRPEVKAITKDELFPASLQSSDHKLHISPAESARIQPKEEQCSLTSDQGKAWSLPDKWKTGDGNWWHSNEHSAAKEVSDMYRGYNPELNQYKPLPESISSRLPSESDKDGYSQIHETEHKIATVSPLILEEHAITRFTDLHKTPLPNPVPQSKSRHSLSIIPEDETTDQVGHHSSTSFAGDLHISTEFKEGATYTDHNSNSVFTVSGQETLPISGSGESKEFIEPETKLLDISTDLESARPSKPPQQVLPQEKTNDENHKQLQNKDNDVSRTSLKLSENETVPNHIVPPVSFYPVIEIKSPMQSPAIQDEKAISEGHCMSAREDDRQKLGVSTGDSTVPEQFQTCPSKVSLDTLDISDMGESPNKLDVINPTSSNDLTSAHQSKPFISHGSTTQENNDFHFRKPISVSLSKSQRNVVCEPETNSTRRTDQSSLLFLSAVEEQLPNNTFDLPKIKPEALVASPAPVTPQPEGSLHAKAGLTEGLQIYEAGLDSPLKNKFVDCKYETGAKELNNDLQSDLLLSEQSTWSGDVIVDFKNEDFWRSEADLKEGLDTKSVPSPGNPFTPTDKTPVLSNKNPFADCSLSHSSEASLPENASFKDLHAQMALNDSSRSTVPANMKPSFLHGGPPLAFSTPSFVAVPNPKLSNFPSPIMPSATSAVNTTTTTNTQSPALSSASSGVKASGLSVLPQETQPAENPFMPVKTSPHPVKPISATLSDSEKKTHKPGLTTALSSGLEMLKSVTSGQHTAPKKQEVDRLKDFSSPDLAAKYYHLTHDELISLLLQREAELGRKQNHVQELENYIDQLLVRIMDQAPTLLQVPLECKKDHK